MIGRNVRVPLLVALLLSVGSAGLGSVGSLNVVAQSDTPVAIVDTNLPSEMTLDEPYSLEVTLENRDDSAIDIWIVYRWDGFEYFSLEARPQAGERRTDLVATFSLRQLEADFAITLRPGETHEHSVELVESTGSDPGDRGTVFDSTSVEVTIVESVGGGDGSSSDAAVSDGVPDRGFFSNTGDEPPFISNVFNLTVLGFVVSIVGLLYQLTEGR